MKCLKILLRILLGSSLGSVAVFISEAFDSIPTSVALDKPICAASGCVPATVVEKAFDESTVKITTTEGSVRVFSCARAVNANAYAQARALSRAYGDVDRERRNRLSRAMDYCGTTVDDPSPPPPLWSTCPSENHRRSIIPSISHSRRPCTEPRPTGSR